ncbi:MAG: hypothetical protein PHI71_06765 [Acidiphilium sp.]|nr:hypothetical protein [Acidiphilium sp.]
MSGRATIEESHARMGRMRVLLAAWFSFERLGDGLGRAGGAARGRH